MGQLPKNDNTSSTNPSKMLVLVLFSECYITLYITFIYDGLRPLGQPLKPKKDKQVALWTAVLVAPLIVIVIKLVIQGSHMVSGTRCPAWSDQMKKRGESRAATPKGRCPVGHRGEFPEVLRRHIKGLIRSIEAQL